MSGTYMTCMFYDGTDLASIVLTSAVNVAEGRSLVRFGDTDVTAFLTADECHEVAAAFERLADQIERKDI